MAMTILTTHIFNFMNGRMSMTSLALLLCHQLDNIWACRNINILSFFIH